MAKNFPLSEEEEEEEAASEILLTAPNRFSSSKDAQSAGKEKERKFAQF